MICPHCLEPLSDKSIVATVNDQEMCPVCAARVVAKDTKVDTDLMQGVIATFLGQSRGTASSHRGSDSSWTSGGSFG
jgi:hypothetical protein